MIHSSDWWLWVVIAVFVALFAGVIYACYWDYKTCKRSHYETRPGTCCSYIGKAMHCHPCAKTVFVCDERYAEVPE